MKPILVALVVLTCAAPLVVRSIQSPAIEPRYECAGTSPDGTRYVLALTVELVGETYRLIWGNNRLVGIGIRYGDRLIAGFFGPTSGLLGVVSYLISPGSLHGRWAVWGDPAQYREECLTGRPA